MYWNNSYKDVEEINSFLDSKKHIDKIIRDILLRVLEHLGILYTIFINIERVYKRTKTK